MSDVLPVMRVLGALLALFAVSMGVPLAASLWAREGLWQHYATAIAVTSMASALLWGGLRAHKRELLPRHGVMLVSVVWGILPLFAALPVDLVVSRIAG